jgi:hypothetical protein
MLKSLYFLAPTFTTIYPATDINFVPLTPEGTRPLGRPRRRWENNIKRDLQEVGGGCGDWKERAQDRDRWWAL